MRAVAKPRASAILDAAWKRSVAHVARRKLRGFVNVQTGTQTRCTQGSQAAEDPAKRLNQIPLQQLAEPTESRRGTFAGQSSDFGGCSAQERFPVDLGWCAASVSNGAWHGERGPFELPRSVACSVSQSCFKTGVGQRTFHPNARLLFTIVRITIHYRVRGTAGLVVIHKCMQWFLTKQTL